ncbi:hypothetical protein MNBD_GAMMA16-1543 [hydrothermal vent metagenome]|uniref:Uncharacterized protein n=1 Tax=hydrothermal vent metagenome TaxID=652676 RepID=A0A3B0ZS26_9ZZZZ
MTIDIMETLGEARKLNEAGENSEAQKLLREVLVVDPGNQLAHLMLGGAYFCENKYTEAEVIFKNLVSLAPAVGKFSIALFNTQWKLGLYKESIAEIKRFLAIADKDLEKHTIEEYVQITKNLANKGMLNIDKNNCPH